MENCVCEQYEGYPCANHAFWPDGLESALESIYSSRRPKFTAELSYMDDSAISAFPLKNLIALGPSVAEASIYDNSASILAGSKNRWIRELTLTQPATMRDPYDLRTALAKIVKSKMFGVVDYLACLELTKEGTPHIHALLLCNVQYVNVSKVKQFWPHRYELKPVRDLEAYIKYMFKEFSNPDIISYCQTKGIDQYVSCSTSYPVSI